MYADDQVPHNEFKTLVESFAQAIWETDADGKIIADSPSWRQYTGQTVTEWLQEGWLQTIHPQDQPNARRQWETSLQQLTPLNGEYRLRSPDGGWRWTNVRAAPARHADGSVRKWIGINIDITESSRARELLRDLEKRTRIALEAAEMGTWEWNLATDEIFWNEQHFQLFGMKPHQQPMKANDFLAHVYPTDRDFIQEKLRRSIEEKVVYEAEFRAVREDMSVRWMSGYGRITDEVDKQPTRMNGVMFDITERKRAEEALREADRRKDEFLAMLAHELRNPLAPLYNTLHLLQLKGTTDEAMASAVDVMTRQVDQLVRLVDDLLDISRISQGKIELRMERTALALIIQDAVETSRLQYEAGGRTLSLTLPNEPIYLHADATRLIQVVSNLLNNAAKFTQEGGKIWLSAGRVGEEVVLEVRDNGIGIPGDQLDRIFDMFTQADTSLVGERGGLGLGLTLVRQLVELHGGRVAATSPGLGQGSTFTIYLPILAADPQPPGQTEHDQKQSSAGHRILVIDDNQDAAQTLGLLLKLTGNDVQTRYSGRAGLEAAETLRPDVILLDLSMPDLDGYDTCRLLREQVWGESMVVIALSGYGQADDKRRTQAAGFDAHLVKPVELTTLIQVMTSLLAGKGAG